MSKKKNDLPGSSEKLLKQARRVHRMYLREAHGVTDEMASLLTPKYPPMTLEFQRSHPEWWDVYPTWPSPTASPTDRTSSANGDSGSHTPDAPASTDSRPDLTDGTTSTESSSETSSTSSGGSKTTTDTLRVAPFTESLPKPTGKPSVEGSDPNAVWVGPVDELHRLLPDAWERIGTIDPDRPFVAVDTALDGATAVGYQNREDHKVYVTGNSDSADAAAFAGAVKKFEAMKAQMEGLNVWCLPDPPEPVYSIDWAKYPRYLSIDKLMADVLNDEALTTRRIMLNDYVKTPKDEIQVEHEKLSHAAEKATLELEDVKLRYERLQKDGLDRQTQQGLLEVQDILTAHIAAYAAREEARERLEGFKLIHNLPPYEKRNGDKGIVSPTGAIKVERKLARFDLIPVEPLRIVAEHYGRATNKYPERNWEAGHEWNVLYGAVQRHLNDFWSGEDIDEETGSPHLAAGVWGLLGLLEYTITHPELDNRPRRSVPD